jgi:hypothetical protein
MRGQVILNVLEVQAARPSAGADFPGRPRVIGGFVLAVFILLLYPLGREEPGAYRLVERGAVLGPSLFTGQVAVAYQTARDHPDLIDKFYCYCRCRENHGHKTLLTCFTNDHGANCDICIHEALTAKRMTDEGKSIGNIQAFFARQLG